MNKKMIAVGIVGTLLLIGLTSLATAGNEAGELFIEKSSTCEKPDLTLEIEIQTLPLRYVVHVIIHNEGTAAVPEGAYIVWKLNDDEYLTIWMKEQLTEPLNPGESIKSPLCGRIEFCKIISSGATITAVVDPVGNCMYNWPELEPHPEYGLICESNEDNNVATIALPNSVVYQSSQSQDISQSYLTK